MLEAGTGEPPGQAVPRAASLGLVPGTLRRAGFPPRATVWLQQSAHSGTSCLKEAVDPVTDCEPACHGDPEGLSYNQ